MSTMRIVTEEAVRPFQQVPFPFHTGHVQGIAAREESFFLSSVDMDARSGLLFRISLPSGELEERRELSIPEDHYHPGGISLWQGRLLVPLAQYTPTGSTVVLDVDPETLHYQELFRCNEHLGALVQLTDELLVGATWEAELFVFFRSDGTPAGTLRNQSGVAYQDMEYGDGVLYCSGVERENRRKGRLDSYTVDWHVGGAAAGGAERSDAPGSGDRSGGIARNGAPTLHVRGSIGLPITPSGVSLAHEGMTFFGDELAFLPEDYPESRLYFVSSNA